MVTLYRSNEITARMAGVLEDSGNLENINDQYANTRLAKRFEDLYDIQWTKLSEWLEENIEDMTELVRIKHLTSLMKVFKCIIIVVSLSNQIYNSSKVL